MESPEVRRRTMQAVKSRDTGPEVLVRKMLHSAGYRYRLHAKQLPGCPDLVFHSRRKAIFVNGCFWHGHSCARGARTPKNNAEYWARKIAGNKARDIKNMKRLRQLGWDGLVVWECEISSLSLERLEAYLG